MKMKSILLIGCLGLANLLNAQVGLGTVSGYLYAAEDSTTVIELSKMWIETESGNRYAESGLDGKFKFDALKPGVYNLHTTPQNYDATMVTGVEVTADGITTLNVYCTDDNVLGVVVVNFNRVQIEKDIPHIKILSEDITHSLNIRDPKGLLVGLSSEIQQVEGTSDIVIRGSRPGDAIFYIDGVKSTDMNSIPGAAVQGIDAFTGGIPAKYGDTTGGVIVLETKSYFDLYYAWKASQQ